jgi:hypothetical protein
MAVYQVILIIIVLALVAKYILQRRQNVPWLTTHVITTGRALLIILGVFIMLSGLFIMFGYIISGD